MSRPQTDDGPVTPPKKKVARHVSSKWQAEWAKFGMAKSKKGSSYAFCTVFRAAWFHVLYLIIISSLFGGRLSGAVAPFFLLVVIQIWSVKWCGNKRRHKLWRHWWHNVALWRHTRKFLMTIHELCWVKENKCKSRKIHPSIQEKLVWGLAGIRSVNSEFADVACRSCIAVYEPFCIKSDVCFVRRHG